MLDHHLNCRSDHQQLPVNNKHTREVIDIGVIRVQRKGQKNIFKLKSVNVVYSINQI